jgi:hypothetical protein
MDEIIEDIEKKLNNHYQNKFNELYNNNKVDISHEKIFDHYDRYDKLLSKYIFSSEEPFGHTPHELYEKICEFVNIYDMKIYIPILHFMTNASNRYNNSSGLPSLHNSLKIFTDTEIIIYARDYYSSNSHFIDIKFVVPDEDIKIIYSSSSSSCPSENYSVNFKENIKKYCDRAVKYIHPEVYLDYINLCTLEEQNYYMYNDKNVIKEKENLMKQKEQENKLLIDDNKTLKDTVDEKEHKNKLIVHENNYLKKILREKNILIKENNYLKKILHEKNILIKDKIINNFKSNNIDDSDDIDDVDIYRHWM